MQGLRYRVIRLMLETIARLRLDHALAPRFRGRGVILTFHHVRPDPLSILPENAGLSITPQFLDAVLKLLRQLDYDILPLGHVASRLTAPETTRPFAVLTFDDGYRDNRDYAAPILRQYAAPYTMFVCPGFAERTAPLWWLDLEAAVMRLDRVRVALPGGDFVAETGTPEAKITGLRALYWRLRQEDEATLRVAVSTLARETGIDPEARVAELCMDWDELRAFSDNLLVNIGAHTLTHPRLAKLDADAARLEMAGSRDRILHEMGIDARHFAYPVGDPTSAGPRDFALAGEVGFEAAVTTVPGILKSQSAPLALPRISVNGLYQDPRYLKALISGVPFALKK
ncbi:MAG: polysaccharide deacetylase [Rhizobiales bacterium PAR1]|nr:MAG: polysaccharide deacetylase [Rhizobiales bacterium PAR1]